MNKLLEILLPFLEYNLLLFILRFLVSTQYVTLLPDAETLLLVSNMLHVLFLKRFAAIKFL